jgi:DNA-binding Lrp family transcriptional regulator
MATLQAQLDDKSKKFLRAVEYYGGEATTSDIRQRTGLTQTEVNYRFDKLEGLELIDITRADVGHGKRDPPKVAHLTGKARREIERGLFGDAESEDGGESAGNVEVSEEEFHAMREELDELRSRVNVLTQARAGGEDGEVSEEVRERVERLEQKVSDVQMAGGSGDGITPSQVAEAPAVKTIEKRVAVLEEDVADIEDYVYEWNEAAETYLRALRKVVEEKLDVSLTSYLQSVEAEDGNGE